MSVKREVWGGNFFILADPCASWFSFWEPKLSKLLIYSYLQHNRLLQASVFRRNRPCFWQLIYPVIRGTQQVHDVSVQRIFRDDGHFH